MVVPYDFEMEWEYVSALPRGIRVHFVRTPYLELSMGIQLARRLGDPEVLGDALRSVATSRQTPPSSPAPRAPSLGG